MPQFTWAPSCASASDKRGTSTKGQPLVYLLIFGEKKKVGISGMFVGERGERYNNVQ